MISNSFIFDNIKEYLINLDLLFIPIIIYEDAQVILAILDDSLMEVEI